MFLEKYNNLVSEYTKGAKRITFRSYKMRKQKDGSQSFQRVKSTKNYDLFFNDSGLLLESRHDSSCLELKTHLLVSLIEFFYEQDKIIRETCFDYYYSHYDIVITKEVKREIYHTYSVGKEVKVMSSSAEDADEDATFFLNFDEHNRTIEEKVIRDNDELIYWQKYIYDVEGNLIKEISLSDDETETGYYEYSTKYKGLQNGYKYYSKDGNNYSQDYTYQFNEKGVWTKLEITRDGIPKFLYERNIEYW